MARTYLRDGHTAEDIDRAIDAMADFEEVKAEVTQNSAQIEDLYGKIGGESYSTEEERVGTWIDGNELFRRTIVATVAITSTDQWAVIEAIPGINVFKISGVAVGNKGLSIPLPYTFSVASNAQTFSLYIFNNEIRYDAKRIDNDTYTLYVTIEYAKNEVE